MTAAGTRAVRISGYASLFHSLDGAGDRVAPGAFLKTLRQRPAARIAMLWQHDPGRPIGRWLRLAETRYGLWAEGQLAPGVGLAREAASLIACGAADGLSIGFKTRRARRAGRSRERILEEIDLWEISLVTFPQVAEARVCLMPQGTRRL